MIWRGNSPDEKINLSQLPEFERKVTQRTLEKSGYGRIQPRWKHEVDNHHNWLDPQMAVKGGDPEKKAAALREAGIPGIKYLDAGSRGKGDGSRNYVVFDENLINIVRKYGIAGASAMLGYNILEGASPAEAKQLQNIETASQPLLGGQGW
jgi:hypothetical protein